LLVTAGEDREIVLSEVAKMEKKTGLGEQHHGCSSVAISPDGKRVAVGCRDGVRILDLPSGKQSARYPGPNRGVSDVAFSPDGSLLASTGEWEVRIWRVETGNLVEKYPATATFVSFTQDGKSLVAGGGDAFVRLWDLDEDNPPQTRPRTSLHAHGGRVYWLAFSPEGDGLSSVGEEGQLIIWDPTPVSVETELVAPGRPTEDAAFARDGRLAVAARGEGVHLLDATTGTVTARPGGSGEEWGCVAASRRRDRLAAVSTAGMVSVWDLRTDRAPRTWQVGWGDGLHSLAFSPDGEMLAVCRWDDAGDAVLLFDASGGTLLHSFPANVPRAVAFSPDGRLVAFDSQNDVLVCDVEERRTRFTLRGHRNSIQALAFSPDGHLIASGGKDRMVYLWDAETGKRRFSLFGHPGDVSTVAFDPDGLTLVAADGSGALKMWQVKTGQELLTLDRGPDEIKKVAFSPDGRQLALMFESGSVRTIHIP
jgi:WD40 repeat protein